MRDRQRNTDAGRSGAFEANFNYRIHEGHDEVTGSFMAGEGTGGHGQFQLIVDVSGAAFQLDRVFVEVFHVGHRDPVLRVGQSLPPPGGGQPAPPSPTPT